ncbi:hypothetical protein P9112_003017 [Eukaryota sp. TZLM1-RC]
MVDEQPSVCVICHESLHSGELAVPDCHCGHVSHESCLDKWLMYKKMCPCCRMHCTRSVHLFLSPSESEAASVELQQNVELLENQLKDVIAQQKHQSMLKSELELTLNHQTTKIQQLQSLLTELQENLQFTESALTATSTKKNFGLDKCEVEYLARKNPMTLASMLKNANDENKLLKSHLKQYKHGRKRSTIRPKSLSMVPQMQLQEDQKSLDQSIEVIDVDDDCLDDFELVPNRVSQVSASSEVKVRKRRRASCNVIKQPKMMNNEGDNKITNYYGGVNN